MAVAAGTAASVAWAVGIFHEVHADTFDPAKTFLVQSGWVRGIGCPTNAGVSTTGGGSPDSTYTDPACPTGDSKDTRNEGLLLAKTGPTANVAAAVADLRNVKGIAVTELGYDLRKPTSTTDPRGSHCGAGAPRFDITLQNGASYFLGCNSPPPTSQTAGNGWLRLRWGTAGTLLAFNASTGALENISGQTVDSIELVFDEGQDTGPDNFGLAVLDNIDVNGTLVGQGNPPVG
ncbi:MAG TPA: hypothetical protein VFA30_04785 [Gaiellaceae bacterium]|nr:hypothetical protein [Gaiellaceae bacterium]